MTIKVLGIAPYPGLRDLLLEIGKEQKDMEMEVEIADLQEALLIVKNAEQKEFDVIVSRGGTASLIRTHVSIPVVDIRVSGYDILRIFTLIRDSNSKVAIIGFPNICQGAAAVSTLLDFEIPIYSIQSEAEVRSALEKAFRHGAQMILGDVVTVKTAQKMGYHGILITSGPESVRESLEEVKRVSEVYLRGQDMARYYKRVLEYAPQGILVVNKAGIVQYVNKAASQRLEAESGSLLGAKLTNISQELGDKLEELIQSQLPVEYTEVRINNAFYKAKIVRDQTTAGSEYMIYLQDSGFSSLLRGIKTPERKATFTQIIGSSETIRHTIDRAKVFAETEKHIWISGKAGSGRSMFAHAIHSASDRANRPFYTVSCAETEREEFGNLLFGIDGETGLLQQNRGATLYLEEITRLPSDLQWKLVSALRKGIPCRLIASSTVPWAELVKKADFLQELAHLLCECHLTIPSLRERPEDLEDLARVLIASHNSQYGKQIVGIRPEVLQRLLKHRWLGNVRELENLIGEMLLLTKSDYVEDRETEQVWERYKMSVPEGNLQTAYIDLSGTWEEIERRILLRISKEEGMNQTKTAKRLGINRTTLWRKIRDLLKDQA